MRTNYRNLKQVMRHQRNLQEAKYKTMHPRETPPEASCTSEHFATQKLHHEGPSIGPNA